METFTLGRYVLREDGEVFRAVDGRRLRGTVGAMGHRYVTLDGKRYSLGRLMLTCFVRSPQEGEVCTYINGDRSCCVIGNLRWATHRETVLRGMNKPTVWHSVGRAVSANYIPVVAIKSEKEIIYFDSIEECVARFDISRRTFKRYVNRKKFNNYYFIYGRQDEDFRADH